MNWLAKRAAQLGRHGARQDVGGAPGRERHHDAHRLAGPACWARHARALPGDSRAAAAASAMAPMAVTVRPSARALRRLIFWLRAWICARSWRGCGSGAAMSWGHSSRIGGVACAIPCNPQFYARAGAARADGLPEHAAANHEKATGPGARWLGGWAIPAHGSLVGVLRRPDHSAPLVDFRLHKLLCSAGLDALVGGDHGAQAFLLLMNSGPSSAA